MEKKAYLSLNWIQKELNVLTEKKVRGKGVFQGWVENLSFFMWKLRKPNSGVNQTLSNERNHKKM